MYWLESILVCLNNKIMFIEKIDNFKGKVIMYMIFIIRNELIRMNIRIDELVLSYENLFE